jgi:hypothetical protein
MNNETSITFMNTLLMFLGKKFGTRFQTIPDLSRSVWMGRDKAQPMNSKDFSLYSYAPQICQYEHVGRKELFRLHAVWQLSAEQTPHDGRLGPKHVVCSVKSVISKWLHYRRGTFNNCTWQSIEFLYTLSVLIHIRQVPYACLLQIKIENRELKTK